MRERLRATSCEAADIADAEVVRLSLEAALCQAPHSTGRDRPIDDCGRVPCIAR
jgi:hypothetical protein